MQETLRMIYVSDCQGSPRLTQQYTDMVNAAKSFLSNYRTYAGASYCETLKSMLDTVDAGVNVTKISGNATLKVTIHGSLAVFEWMYTYNDVVATSKAIGLGFENGFLKYFIGNWGLYKIGSYDINLSEQEAVSIAINATENYSWKAWIGNYSIDVTEFNVSKVCGAQLAFLNKITEEDARDGDPLTLYPVWRVRLALDKLYPGNVYGLIVDVWADTRTVSSISTASYMGTPPSNGTATSDADSKLLSKEVSVGGVSEEQVSTSWITPSILVIVNLGVVVVCLRNRVSAKLRKRTGLNSLKLCGALFILLFLLIFMATPLRVASAELADPRGKAVAYGITWGVTETERGHAEDICQYLEDNFDEQDYSVTNAYGSDTTKSNVLNGASLMAYGYHRVALFHYGHGGRTFPPASLHWDYFDNYGWESINNQIWDYEVYDKTGLGKHFFVFLWVCRQGDVMRHETSGGGMAYAWAHRDLSEDGFNNPDDGLYCFISFKDASPPLDQYCRVYGNPTYYKYKDFLMRFYDEALNDGYSIKTSLDHASTYTMNGQYLLRELYLGFTAYWPEVEPFEGGVGTGWMKVYGNSNIHLNQMEWQLNVCYNGYIPNKDVCVDLPYNLANTGSPILLNEGYHTVFVNDFWGNYYDGYRYGFEYYFYGEEILTYNNPAYGYFNPSLPSVTHVQFGLAWNPFDINNDGYFTWYDVYLYDYYAYYYIPNYRGDLSFNYNSRYDLNADGDVDWEDYDVFWYWVYTRLC